jgi:hypothetical protein
MLSHFERELAEQIANRAQIVGWDKAVGFFANEYKVKPLTMSLLLDSVAEYNDKADPSGRVEELEDYVGERDGLLAPESLRDSSDQE